MKQLNNKKELSNHSLLSDVEYILDEESHIRIITRSLFNRKTKLIPLNLINPEPIVECKLKSKNLVFALTTLIFGMVFITYSQIVGAPLFSIFNGIFILFSAVSLGLALKQQETIYSFFLDNSKTKAFSITDNQVLSFERNKPVNPCEIFIASLRKKVLEKKSKSKSLIFESDKDKHHFLKTKLDEIYNYGVVNETVYDIIEDTITAKIFGLDNDKIPSKENNIIAFQAKKQLMESA